MVSLTIPEAHARAADLATRFTTALPGITAFSPSNMAPHERARCIDVRAIVGGLRHAALLLIAAYNPTQVWFWMPQWQAGERQVDARRAAEGAAVYHTDEEFLAALDADL